MAERASAQLTFGVAHAFALGAKVLDAQLSYCAHCQTLRVEQPGKATSYIRRRPEAERVIEVEPPCVSPGRFEAPW